MAKQKYDFDLIVIGSGASGSVAADIVAAAKWRVAIVEHDVFGGEAANWGGIPSKAILRATEVFDAAKNHGPALGLRTATVGYNYPSIRAWKETVVRRSGVANTERYYQNKGISVFHGEARFISPHEITVNRRHLSSRHFLIATGAVASDGNVQGLDKTPHLTPRNVLDINRPPKTIFIVGGGSTGCEFANIFSTFGSKVFIAEEAVRLLPKEDRETSDVVANNFASKRGVKVLTHAKVIRIAKDGVMVRVTYLIDGVERSEKVDSVLLAAGKIPHTDLGLENAKIDFSPRGVEVDEYLETSTKGIFAAGDVLGQQFYTHTSVYESRIAANNLLNPRRKIIPNYTAVPRVTSVIPEIASVGMSEADCLKRDLRIQTAIAPLHIIARSNIDNYRDGFVKVITDKNGILLGATVASPHAGEIIHELTLAIQIGLTAHEVANTLHAFPSWSEAVRVACSKIKV